jgi:putative endonuclease
MSSGARNQSLGAYGERVAVQRLVADGMVLVDRNWRCPAGELDLVLREEEVLVFCEVKTRRSSGRGHPLEVVQSAKAARLRRLAALWCEAHDVRPREARIDVVGVLLQARGAAEVTHLRGIG